MKKIILASVVAVAAVSSMNANASGSQVICAAPSAAAAGNSILVTAAAFIKTSFTPKCSANVYLHGYDADTFYGTGAASSKGKNIFMGSTGGGGVVASGSCATTGCTAANTVTAALAAPAS